MHAHWRSLKKTQVHSGRNQCTFSLAATHSEAEERFYCIGKSGGGILTVRFTYRSKVIRIIGAGYWRKGKAIYEKEDRLHG
ncbi:MAG: BrnT family toxin [Betaproteobacteria bacterium]|nr:BrnT family toxin [Betaproteobacteria bacterium]